MADNQEINTGGGSAIQGNVSTNGGDAALRDRITFNNNEGGFGGGYTLADLRLDIRFLKQEVDRLKEDLSGGRYSDKRVSDRISEIEANIVFLEEQVKGMLLLRPVSPQTPTVSSNAFAVFLVIIGFFIVLMVILLIFIARGG